MSPTGIERGTIVGKATISLVALSSVSTMAPGNKTEMATSLQFITYNRVSWFYNQLYFVF
jgi:hypothetical protein